MFSFNFILPFQTIFFWVRRVGKTTVKGEFKEMNNEILKQKVRELKEFGISYVSITKKLGWGETTLYRWMKGEFNLSEQKVEELTQLINKIGRME